MEQEDYLKRQIDQLARVLGKLLFDRIGLKNSGQINGAFEMTSQTLKNELELDLHDLLELSPDQFIDTLTIQKNVSNDSLNKLAEILLLIADERPGDKKQLYEKSYRIYEYLERTENTYALDRKWKMNQIKSEL